MCVFFFYFFKGRVFEERWRSGEGCGANNHMHLVKLQCKVDVSQTFFFFNNQSEKMTREVKLPHDATVWTAV